MAEALINSGKSGNGGTMRRLREQQGEVAACRHWLRKGACMYKETNSCSFRHDPEDRGKEIKTQKPRQNDDNNRRVRVRTHNDGRAACLRRWCVRTFGVGFIQGGTGVLDIAGGKGELAFEMLALNGFQTTVIDPRVMNVNRFQRKLAFGFYHRNAVLNEYNTAEAPATPPPGKFTPGVPIRQPLHIRGMFRLPSRDLFDPDSLAACQPCAAAADTEAGVTFPLLLRDEAVFLDELAEARRLAWTDKGLGEDGGDDGGMVVCDGDDDGEDDGEAGANAPGKAAVPRRLDCDRVKEAQERDKWESHWGLAATDGHFIPGKEIASFHEARRLVAGCSIVVGMHPDQGAEPLIDFALSNAKPFAVVPCCVYSKQFPKRKGRDGRPVRCYGEFIDYLLAKDPGIRTAELDFEGLNVLLYHLGGQVPLVDPTLPALSVVRGPSQSAYWWTLSTQAKRDRSRRRATARTHLGPHGDGRASRDDKIAAALAWFEGDAPEEGGGDGDGDADEGGGHFLSGLFSE